MMNKGLLCTSSFRRFKDSKVFNIFLDIFLAAGYCRPICKIFYIGMSPKLGTPNLPWEMMNFGRKLMEFRGSEI